MLFSIFAQKTIILLSISNSVILKYNTSTKNFAMNVCFVIDVMFYLIY